MIRRTIRTLAALCLVGLSCVPLHGQTATLSPSPYLTIVDANGATVSGSCVWTYIAGSSTAATTWTDKAMSTPNSNPVEANANGQLTIFLLPGQSYKFIVEGDCTPPAHGTVIRTQDNIDAVPSVFGVIDILGTAGGALSTTLLQREVAYLSDGTDGNTAGTWLAADADAANTSLTTEIGFATQNIVSGSTGLIRQGGVLTGFTGLTPGANYYVSTTAGAITATAPSNARRVGQADSTGTALLIDAGPRRVDGTVYILNKSTTEQIVTNSGAATSVYSFSVPGGTLGTTKTLRLTVTGEYINTSGGPSNFSVASTYGGANLASGVAVAYATATTGPVRLVFELNANGATNSQRSTFVLSGVASGTTVATGVTGVVTGLAGAMNDVMAVDSTVAQTVTVTVQHSVVAATVTFKRWAAILEVLGS